MKSVLFWTSCVIGFVIIMILYIQNKAQNVENFEVASTFTETPFVPQNLSQMLFMYLSSFSDTAADNITPIYQGGGTAYWRDLKDPTQMFNVIGTTLPTTLRNPPPNNGISMKNVKMIGPPSESFPVPNTGYILDSISIAFYGTWKTVDLDAPLILFQLFAETPNSVKITYLPIANDPANVKLSIIIGDASKSYDWVIPKTTILTQSLGTLYTFVFDKTGNTITPFVGSTNLGSQNLSEQPIIKLSNSPITINETQNWDFQLKAVLLLRGVITPADILSTTDYFNNIASGKVQEVTQLQQETTQVKQNLETCNSKLPRLLAQIENLQGEVMYNETEMKDLRKKLEREKLACMKAASGDKSFKWLIANGKCPDVRSAPKGVHEFPHLIQKVTVGLQNEPQISKDANVVIAPPTTTGTFQHAIQPIGSAEHSSWLSKWVPLVK